MAGTRQSYAPERAEVCPSPRCKGLDHFSIAENASATIVCLMVPATTSGYQNDPAWAVLLLPSGCKGQEECTQLATRAYLESRYSFEAATAPIQMNRFACVCRCQHLGKSGLAGSISV